MQYCSLQHWTLLPLPVTSSTGYFFFDSVCSFFLEIILISLYFLNKCFLGIRFWVNLSFFCPSTWKMLCHFFKASMFSYWKSNIIKIAFSLSINVLDFSGHFQHHFIIFNVQSFNYYAIWHFPPALGLLTSFEYENLCLLPNLKNF